MPSRLISILLAVAVLAIFTSVSPASADAPIIVESSATFEDVNPCTGELHEITLSFVDRIHEHDGNFLYTSDRSGTTDTGFSIVNGTESFVDNGRVIRGTFVDNWANPETDERFQARGAFVFNVNRLSLKVDRFTLRCVAAET